MSFLKTVMREQYDNIYLIRRLSVYELKQAYAASALGIAWAFLNPLLQVITYWLVFGLGIRGGAPVAGVPYFIWMICGLIPWLYISVSIGKGSNSIYSKLGTVSKMNFPLSIIPTYVVISQLYTHLILVALLLLFVIIMQGIHLVSIVGLLYGMIAVTSMLITLAFVTSTLSTILRDFQLLIQSATRMLFFLTPVLWVLKDEMPPIFLFMIKLNPFYYVIEVYRESLLYNNISVIASPYTLYFWGIVAILLVVGSLLHIKFRQQFVDYM